MAVVSVEFAGNAGDGYQGGAWRPGARDAGAIVLDFGRSHTTASVERESGGLGSLSVSAAGCDSVAGTRRDSWLAAQRASTRVSTSRSAHRLLPRKRAFGRHQTRNS